MTALAPKQKHSVHHVSGNIVGRMVKVVVPLAISATLILWLFHKINIGQVEMIIREGVDYSFIVVMMILTVLSLIIRGVRWGIQLRAVGIPRMSVMTESVSIFGAYALNMIIPYLGEAWRCVYVSKRENARISTVVGTDIGDRVSDAIVIMLLMVLTMFVAGPAIESFMNRFVPGEHMASDTTVWIWFLAAATGIVAVCYWFRDTPVMKSIAASASRIWKGFIVLFHLRQTGLYLILTLAIWACYFLETYICFFAFPFTRTLIESHTAWGMIPGLVVFVFGSATMLIPSNGGLGPWNIAVMFALTIYGISQNDAAAYAIVCWSFQAIIQIVLGIFSAIYIIFTRHSVKKNC